MLRTFWDLLGEADGDGHGPLRVDYGQEVGLEGLRELIHFLAHQG